MSFIFLLFLVSLNAHFTTPDELEVARNNTELNGIAVMYRIPNCHFCKIMYEEWNDVMNDLEDVDGVVVGMINCEDYSEYCKEHNIQSYPTLHFYKGNTTSDLYRPRECWNLKLQILERLYADVKPKHQ
ncbi:Thioredoxin [Entamoeba marina]